MPGATDRVPAAMIGGVARDLRHSLRALRRSPGFTAVVVLTLALGVAGTTAAFSIVEPVLGRGLPYRAPDRLRTVFEQREGGGTRLPSAPTVRDWQQQLGTASNAVAGVTFVRGNTVTLPVPDRSARGFDAREYIDAYVSPEFFTLMGAQPYLGRVFGPDENRPGAPAVAVISYDLFENRFGGDRTILGRTLDVDSLPTTIIGVMPRAFSYPNWAVGAWVPTELWQPIRVFEAAHAGVLAQRGLHVDSRTVLRLRSGVDSARAASAMRVVQARLAAEYPAEQGHWTSVALQSLNAELFGDLPRMLRLVSGAILLVLLLACANVANLFLVRGSRRERELAVRTALGAGRWRLVRQLFVEALVLAAAAGGLGVLAAGALVGYARHTLGALLPFSDRLAVDPRALLFAGGVTVATALLVGLGPALHVSRGDLMQRIRTGGVSAAGDRRERRARNLLVSLQFALALTLLIGSGLLVQSFRRLLSVPLGYDPHGLVDFAVAPSDAYAQPQAAAALYARIISALDALPDVEAAAAVGGALLPTKVLKADLPAASQPLVQAAYHPASTDFLRTYRMAMVAGRWFTDADMRSPTGLVVSSRLAHQLWGTQSALGRRITVFRQSQARANFGQPITLPVIGVAADVRENGPASEPTAEVYLPYTLEVWPWMTFAVRSSNPSRTARAVKAAVRAVAPDIRFRWGPSTGQSGFALIDAQTRFVGEVLSGFALGALILAAVGLYGIVAYTVSQRTREIGIRLALGASGHRVTATVMRDGLQFVVLGAALGVAGAVASTRLLRSMLFQTTTTDPETFVAVTVALAVVALVASYLPARRAARTDPTIAMRVD